VDLVLVFLQSDQPPTAKTHTEKRKNTPQYRACQERTTTMAGQSNEQATPCCRYERGSQGEMAKRGSNTKLSAEDWKQAVYLYGEKSQREHMCSGGQS
jgi:hypothetical protein